MTSKEKHTSFRLSKWLIVTSLIILIPFLGFQACTYNHHLKLIPSDMGVWRVTYSLEKVWGFGPGGNETGLIVYDLPKDVAQTIKEQGLDYLSKLPSKKTGRDWRGIYKEWHSTPIPKSKEVWYQVPVSDKVRDKPYLDNYLDRYGFGINVDKSIEDEINNVISSSGSYFSYGRTGVIIVAPDIEKVFYAYSG
jgi:hypothetical protein